MLEKKCLPDPSNIFLVELNAFKDINSHGCISSRATSQLPHLMFPLTHKYHYRERRVCPRLDPFSMASKVTVHPASARKRTGESKVGMHGACSFLHPNHSSSMMGRRPSGAYINKVVLKTLQ